MLQFLSWATEVYSMEPAHFVGNGLIFLSLIFSSLEIVTVIVNILIHVIN